MVPKFFALSCVGLSASRFSSSIFNTLYSNILFSCAVTFGCEFFICLVDVLWSIGPLPLVTGVSRLTSTPPWRASGSAVGLIWWPLEVAVCIDTPLGFMLPFWQSTSTLSSFPLASPPWTASTTTLFFYSLCSFHCFHPPRLHSHVGFLCYLSLQYPFSQYCYVSDSVSPGSQRNLGSQVAWLFFCYR